MCVCVCVCVCVCIYIYIYIYIYILTFSLRGVLSFVASGLDINSCVLSYFEGTVNLHRYTSCTLTTLHCSKVSFLQCCHIKRYNTIFTKMWGVYSLLWDTLYMSRYISKNSNIIKKVNIFCDWKWNPYSIYRFITHRGKYFKPFISWNFDLWLL